MDLLCIEFVPLNLRMMNFPIQIPTKRMGVSIICFKGSQEDFPNRYVLQSLKIAYIIANSADPDGMQITKLPF